MAQTADIIIVGGGVIGASIAYTLAQRGAGRIILLERNALSTGTTGHSGGIIRQYYSNDVTIRMAQESLRVFEHFDEIIGGACGFTKTGLLILSDQSGANILQTNIERQQRLGVATKSINPSDIDEVAPGYNPEGVSLAAYEEDAGIADPVATTYSFAKRARELGAIIHEGIPVTQLLTQNERITGVATTHETFLAPQVIIAANVWSSSLTQPLGISLPLKPTRHPMLVLRHSPMEYDSTSMHPICFDGIQGIYLRPVHGGVTLVGSTHNVETESDPDHYMRGITEAEIDHFSTTGAKRLPALTRTIIHGGWAGLYDDTPDYHPILGQLAAYEGLYCAVGFSGHGFKLAPCIGNWMAQLILTGHAPADMEYFTYERFSQGRHIHPSDSTSGVIA